MTNKVYILIAEDDTFNGKVYQKRFEKEGYEVKLVYNGQEALASLKERKPDLLLLDLIMPIMDGFEVLAELQKGDGKGLKTIVLSNLGQEDDIKKAKELGAIDYLAKASNTLQDIADKVIKYAKN